MHEILGKLTRGQRVLDLGARSGSFHPGSGCEALVVRLDLDQPPIESRTVAVQADAARLPFRDACFDAVIANHSLEHMDRLDDVLAGIARVARSSGALYVSVPDSTTFSDRLYRWVYHGGGHVNPFRSPDELDDRIRKYIPLSRVGYRTLYSSFGFLEKRHFHPRPPRRMWLFLNGRYPAVVILGYLARALDRLFRTRLSIYGWAMYYGSTSTDMEAWTNVCVRCGNAQPAELLHARILLWPIRYYRCPVCTAWNLFTTDPSPVRS
jgi:SAM-dependent methyltransferase